MATPTEPITGALFRALRTTADPELARAAEEEIRQIASQNVIAVLGAKKLKEPALTPKPHGLTFSSG